MKKNILLIAFSLIAFLTIPAHGNDNEFTVLQWNVWQEGTKVPGGYEAIANEIARLKPDFVALSEVRNYNNTRFCDRIVASLKERGITYYSFYSYDSGLLSKHPITDSTTIYPEKDDHGSIYRLTASAYGKEFAIYTAHLDYQDCAYYNVRGYDGTTWKECERPKTVEEVLKRNDASKRDDAIRAFIHYANKDLAEGRIVVLGGDFNEPSHRDWTESNKDLYEHNGMVIGWTATTLLEQAGYSDAYRVLFPDPLTHPGFTYPSDNEQITPENLTWAPQSDERERIDFVFYQGKGIKPTEALIFGPENCIAYSKRTPNQSKDPFLKPLSVWPTDHKGLWVKFNF